MAVIGIDLGGTKLATALFSKEGTLLRKARAALEKRQGGAVGALIERRTRIHLEEAAAEGLRVEAIGVSVPGIYHARTGTVWAPNIPGWEDYPLLAQLEALAGDEIRVHVDSDRACYILGETWQGTARGCRNAIFLAVGTGIGAGILVEGNVLRGHSDIAGAIGWLALDRPYRPAYAACGCFEHHASGTGLANKLRAYLEARSDDAGLLRRKNWEDLTAADVFKAYAVEDPLARQVVEEGIAFWGMAVANLVSLFNPEQIIFGGGIFGPAAQLLGRIRTEAERWAQPISMQQVKLTVSSLGGEAGLYGAARLALQAITAGS